MKLYRQGDVLLRKVEKDDSPRSSEFGSVMYTSGIFDSFYGISAREPENVGHSYVLAYGEKTGHKHLLTTEGNIEVTKRGGLVSFVMSLPGTLTHDEHGPITLEPGEYEVTKERSLDHAHNKAYNAID